MAGKPGESLQAQAAATQNPKKINAAPKPVKVTQATGLCSALNLYYAEQAKSRGGKSDIYEIQFLDSILSDAKVTPPGAVDKAFAGGNPQGGPAIDPKRQNFDPNIRVRSVTAGQQITQVIDEVMRSSSYISDQQKAQWEIDPATGQGQWLFKGKPAQNFAWFDISCEAQVLGYDEQARCNVYRMIYKVAPYQTTITSEYFDPGAFRGVHKVFNYWFTGQNTQVLQYEQSFNSLWSQTISSGSRELSLQEDIQNQVNSRVIWKKRSMPASNQSREGGENKVFEPGANAADILYTQDLANVTLTVIGDPAWIPSPKTPQPGNFVVTPFFPDGSINFGAGSPYFELAWNRPVDYNIDTGLMDPGQNNYFADRANGRAGLSQESVIYKAVNVKSTFSRGKFTQEIKGAWLMDGQNKTTTAPAATSETTRTAGTFTNDQALTNATELQQAGVQKAAEAERLAQQYSQYRSVPTSQVQANVVTGGNTEAPLAATPPIQTTEATGFTPPLKLGAGGYGFGVPVVNSDDPQLIAKDA
jgi:hypothetical protein